MYTQKDSKHKWKYFMKEEESIITKISQVEAPYEGRGIHHILKNLEYMY
jgi:hypothetical protein